MSMLLPLIPLLVAMSAANASSDAYQICEGFVDESKVFSTQDPSDLAFARSTLSKATDVATFERLFKRDFDGLLQTYTARGLSLEQATAEMLKDLKSWMIAQINTGIALNGVTDEVEWAILYKNCLDNVRG
jgi:hypothetical protein